MIPNALQDYYDGIWRDFYRQGKNRLVEKPHPQLQFARDKDGFILPLSIVVKFYSGIERVNDFVGIIRQVQNIQPFLRAGNENACDLSRTLLFITDEDGKVLDASRSFKRIKRIPTIDTILSSSETLYIQDLAEELAPQTLWDSDTADNTLLLMGKEVTFDVMREKVNNSISY